MTALWVFLWMSVVFGVLLACPVRIRAGFEDGFSAQVRFLFFRYRIYPRPEQKKEKPAKEEEERKKPKIPDIIREKGLSGFLGILKELARIASGTARRVLARFCIDSFELDAAVCGSDAAHAAVNFGAVCSAVYSAAGVLAGCMKFRDRSINIVPDYNGSESRVRFRLRAHVRLFFLVSALLWGLAHSGGLLKALKEKSVL
jgi:hypothetical protein